MILLIAWRNIWRNRVRSIVMMLAIVLGITAGTVAIAFFYGMNEQRIKDATRLNTSHFQVHHPEFVKDPVAEFVIPDADAVAQRIRGVQGVTGVTLRMVNETMISNAHGSRGVIALAVNPEDENAVTGIGAFLTEGVFLDSARQPIAVGRKLADALGLKLKSKVEIQFQSPEGDFMPVTFTVTGIFKTKSGFYDETTVLVRLRDVRRQPGLEAAGLQEIAILTEDYARAPELKGAIAAVCSGLTVQTWKEIAPELGYAHDLIGVFLVIFLGIIMTALAFGILNLMMMAVLERQRELGMVMALGMTRWRVFAMVMAESVMLALTAAPFGFLAAFGIIEWLKVQGVDLSIVSEGMAAFGIDTVIYPQMPEIYYLYQTIMVIATALLSSLLPARRAVRLSPAEATRK